jgi:hypothetical protein
MIRVNAVVTNVAKTIGLVPDQTVLLRSHCEGSSHLTQFQFSGGCRFVLRLNTTSGANAVRTPGCFEEQSLHGPLALLTTLRLSRRS